MVFLGYRHDNFCVSNFLLNFITRNTVKNFKKLRLLGRGEINVPRSTIGNQSAIVNLHYLKKSL